MLTNVWRRLCLSNLKHFSASDCVRMLYFLYGSHYEVRMKFVIQPADSRKKVERFFLTNWGIHSNFSISISDRPARDLRVNRRISVIRQSQLRVEIKVSAQSRELSVKIRISRINLIRLRRFTLWVGLHQFYAMGHFEATQCSPRHSQVRRRTSGTLNSSPSHWLGVSFVHRLFRSPFLSLTVSPSLSPARCLSPAHGGLEAFFFCLMQFYWGFNCFTRHLDLQLLFGSTIWSRCSLAFLHIPRGCLHKAWEECL